MLSITCTVLVLFGCSGNSNNGTVTVAPLAPTYLTGTVISTMQVNLSWTDNATNEDGYKIERKTDSGNFTVVGSAGANISNFSDLGLTANTTYTYRVYAYNSAGSSLQYSNEVIVMTQDSIPSWLINGLVGYWPFNGNANDESGNGNNGMVNGATLTADRFGNVDKAYSFNGNGDLINTSNIFYNANNNHSISMWFYSTSDNNSTFFDTNPTAIEAYATSYYLNPANNFTFSLGNGSIWTSHPSNCYFPCIVNLNSWHHFTVVSLGLEYKFYLDGALKHTYNPNNLPLNQLVSVYFGGSSVGPGGGYFKGKLDDIRIYNRALSASEVSYLASH